MMQRRTIRSLTRLSMLLPVLVAGCRAGAPDATVVVALTSGLTAAEADYVEVSAIQGGTITRAVADDDGVVRLRVVSGIEVRLVATVFDVGGAAWNAFDGTHIFEPDAGPNVVEVEMQAAPATVGSVQPVFLEETGTETLRLVWTDPAPLRVRDVATGFEVADVFTTLQELSLPDNRAFVLGVVRPDTGELVEITAGGTAPFGDGFTLELGAAPAEPTAAAVAVNGDTADLSGVQFEQAFAVECASGDGCDNPDLAWEPCDADVNLPHSGLEQQIEVFVRYDEIRELCGSVNVTRDLTKPTATLAITPNHLATSANPGVVSVEVVPSEPLEPTSIVVDAAAGTYSCLGGIQAGRFLTAGFSTWVCDLDVSTWTSGSIDLTVIGTDLAGNAFQTRGLVPDVTPAASSVLVVGAHPYPEAPDLEFGVPFLLGIDVVNLSPDGACNFGLVTQPSILDADTGSPVTDLVPAMPAGTYLGLVEGNGGRGTMWIEVNPQAGAAAGDYLLIVDVTATDCIDRGNATTVPVNELGLQLPFTVQPHPFRFIGGEALQLGRLTGISPYSPYLQVDAVLGLAAACANGVTLSSDDPGVATTDFVECPDLFVEGAGSALLTAGHPDGRQATVQIDVNPAPELLVLQADVVTKMTQDNLDTLPVDTRVGTPRRLLWESTLDAIVVVGDAGVQLASALADTVVPLPCSAESIVDGALTSAGAGQPNAGVALLTKRADSSLHHCEVSLDGSVSGSAALAPVLASCAAPTRMVSNPVSGSFTVAGDGCVATYSATGTSVTGISSATSARLRGTPEQVAYDPFGNYLAVKTPNSVSPAGGWRLGPVSIASAPFDVDPYLLGVTWADAVTIDPVDGAPIVSSNVYSGSQLDYLMRFQDRLTRQTPEEVSMTAGSGARWTRLALDAADRVLYAADNGTTPAVWSIDADNYYSVWLIERGVRFLQSTGPVVDMVVAGPQPVAAEPRAARPGDVVTISGTGFAGNGQDEVFVLGVRAETLASSPTHVLFRVPHSLDALQRDLPRALLTVRSHGRMSGPVPAGFGVELAWPSRFYRQTSTLGTACGQPGLCTDPLLLEGRDGFFAVRPTTGVDPGVYFVDGSTLSHSTAASHAVLLPGGRRLLGHAGSGLINDYALLQGSQGFESARIVRDAAPATMGAMAVDAAGSELIALEDGVLTRLWATTLEPRAAPALPTPTISSIALLAMMPDGSAVVAASQSAQMEVFRLDTGAAQVVTPDAGCPVLDRLEGMWPRFRDVPELYVALGNTSGSLLASAVLQDDAGTFTLTCTSSVATYAASEVGLSPLGDALVVMEGGWSTLAYSIRLLDPDNLTHEFDYLTDAIPGQVQGVLVGNGPYWDHSQRVAIPTSSNVDAGAIYSMRSYTR